MTAEIHIVINGETFTIIVPHNGVERIEIVHNQMKPGAPVQTKRRVLICNTKGVQLV